MKLKRDMKDVAEIRVRRRRGRFLFWITITILAIITALILFLLIVLRTPIFQVQKIKIEGLSRIPEEDVRGFLTAKVPDSFFGHLLGARTILVWPKGFERDELALLPETKAIKIDRHYFRRTIVATVIEAERKGIWCFRGGEESKCFWFDEEGRLLRRVARTSGNLIQVVDDYSRSGVTPGDPALPPRLFPNMLSVLASLQRAEQNVSEIRINNLALEEVTITTEGPNILMSLRFPAPDLRTALDALRDKVSMANLQYLDFRVEKRVYYK